MGVKWKVAALACTSPSAATASTMNTWQEEEQEAPEPAEVTSPKNLGRSERGGNPAGGGGGCAAPPVVLVDAAQPDGVGGELRQLQAVVVDQEDARGEDTEEHQGVHLGVGVESLP